MHALATSPPAPALALLAVPALWPWRWRLPFAFFVLGVLLVSWRAQFLLDARWPEARHGEELTLRGAIASLPERHDEPASARREASTTWRFLFEPGGGGTPQRVRVSWYRSDAVVRGGECWTLRLRLRTPRGSLNPGAFDYEGWLFRQGITATATVRDAQPCGAAPGYPVLRARQALRDRLDAALEEHPARGLLIALALGDDSGLRDADWDLFRVSGTSHLVAISGLNLAVVAGFVFFLARWLWSASARLCLAIPAQKAGLVASALAAAGYALLAGFEAPVARALLMLLVVLAALGLDRLAQASRGLALAWLAILLADPFAVLSPGLWLSFGAVAAILYLTTARRRAPRPWIAALVLQLALSVALAPLSLYFFSGLAWAAPLVNLAAVPWFTLLTPVVLGAALAVGLDLSWAPAAARGVADLLQGTVACLGGIIERLPDPWLPAGPPALALGLALAGTAFLFAPRGLPLRVFGVLCFVPLLVPPQPAPDRAFELVTLDVGQGLAVVVRTAGHVLLYDAGPAFEDGFDAGESVVAPYLLRRGVRRLDALMVSHGDNDHAGGVAAVRARLEVDREIGTARGEPCRQGLDWTWDGVRFRTLHPNTAGGWSDNDGSCVLRVEAPGFSALLAGDIEADAEAHLVRTHGAGLRADVLVAPHHGSRTSSSPEFVAAVAPRIVLFSAAWRSHYGHPRPEVVARYRALGARTAVTGAEGALAVAPDMAVRSHRAAHARFWNAAAEADPR